MNPIPHSRDSARATLRGRLGPLHAYVAALTVVALGTAAVLILFGQPIGSIWIVLVLALAAAAAERGSVRFTDTTELSISPVLMLFAAVLFGPLAGGLVGAASELGDSELLDRGSPGRSPRLKWLTYTSSRFLVGAATGGVAMAMLAVGPEGTGGVILATLGASIAGESLELVFAAVTSRIRGNKTSFSARTLAPLLATAVCVYAPVVALLTLAYTEVSPWTAPLFIAPALAAQRLFAMYLQQRTLAFDLQGANERLNRSNLEFAEALVATLEQSDLYTAGHSKAVAIYSRDIAERMGLCVDTQERAYLCGLVHDLGKVGLPASLLLKNGPLTLEERREMQRHSEIGESILERVEAYADVALIVRHHHERIDGEGYPDCISGEAIPPISRIIAVADAYNAMTSDRPYRDAMPSRIARLRLAQSVESQFDTSVVAAFEAILAGAAEDYRTAKRADFHPISAAQLRSLDPPPASMFEVA
jgi:HD-GYP domain-containing protein (c-di-GMP phosphodiesterase class II)